MTNLESTIASLREELTPLENREEFLAYCAKKRIETLTTAYDKKFDQLISNLGNQDFRAMKMDEVLTSVKVFSETTSKLFDSFIVSIKQYNSYINKT